MCQQKCADRSLPSGSTIAHMVPATLWNLQYCTAAARCRVSSGFSKIYEFCGNEHEFGRDGISQAHDIEQGERREVKTMP